MYACAYVCVRALVSMCSCVHVCLYVFVYLFLCACICVCVLVFVSLCACSFIRIGRYICILIHLNSSIYLWSKHITSISSSDGLNASTSQCAFFFLKGGYEEG